MSSPLIRTGVVAFLLVDAALGVLAWRHVHEGESAAPTGETVGAVTQPTASVPAGTGTADFQPQDPSTATMIVASADGVLIVATAGLCDGTAPSVLVSDDGGANFSPVKPVVSRVLAVSVQANGDLNIVGADDDCEAIELTSDDGGATWTDTPVDLDWYRDPASLTGVTAGTEQTDTGCDVMALDAVSTTVARVSCGDGSMRGTDDAGKTWTTIGGIRAVRALSFKSPASGVALVQTDDCSASAFVTGDAGRTWIQRGCIDGQTAQAIVHDDDRLLASVDAKVSQSTDGGSTWTPVGAEGSGEGSEATSAEDPAESAGRNTDEGGPQPSPSTT